MKTSNKQPKTATGFRQPQWFIKWQKMMGPINFYPLTFGIMCYFLLFFLPENILTLHPTLKTFTDFMSSLVPAISAFANNVPQESVRFIYALSWAMLPLWIPFYMFSKLKKTDQEVIDTIHMSLKRSKYPLRTQLRLMLLAPLLLIGMIWAIWSGYAFEGGEPSIAKSLTYTNNFFIAFWAYVFSQGFLLSILGLLAFFRMTPLILKLYSSKDYK
jgi:hypothetical protein